MSEGEEKILSKKKKKRDLIKFSLSLSKILDIFVPTTGYQLQFSLWQSALHYLPLLLRTCFKFELESFNFPIRLISLYLPALQYLFCNSAVLASRYVASAAAAARSVAVTNTIRIFEIRLGLPIELVHANFMVENWNGSQKLQAMARWNSAFDSEFEHRGSEFDSEYNISQNSDNWLIVI